MFKREGIFSLVGEGDLLGNYTKFRQLVEVLSEKVVQRGSWFCFCTSISSKQVDLMKYKDLGKLVSSSYPESTYRTAIYKYMLSDYLCYVETPTITKDTAKGYGFKDSFNKFLATSNSDVVSKWSGLSLEEVNQKYGEHLETCLDDYPEDTFPYLKLWDTKGIRKITKPRSEIDLSKAGTRVIPLFALKKGVEQLHNLGMQDYLSVSFVKDSGVERDIDITFCPDKIREIYGDTDFFRRGLESQFSGNFMENDNINRGYIRVFEIGGSIYDSPTRSINYARITGVKKIKLEDINLSYINIDLSRVVSTFKNAMITGSVKAEDLVYALKDFDAMSSGEVIRNLKELDYWVDSQVTKLSTVFLRKLALFMIGNPQWFNGYIGEGISESVSSTGQEFSEGMLDFSL